MYQIFLSAKGRYTDPQYPFKDRLYFLFGTAGLMSAGAAYVAAICSGLPHIAAAASLLSFFIMLILMTVSFFMKDISVNRVICSAFLNFFMFPVLFWVTGGVNCGMVFYFILGLSVAALILDGKARIIILTLSVILDAACLNLGFHYPDVAYPLSYEERWMDTVSSFLIVAFFIIAVIIMMTVEYEKEHDKVLDHAAQLKQQSITDSLTGLYNRRYLMAVLEQLASVFAAEGTDACIIMFDIDDFKKINDSFGHLCGDQVLWHFAAAINEKAGEKNIAARYGGEEFIMALPGCGLRDALECAEKIRLDTHQDKILSDLTEGRFSVSAGVAVCSSSSSVDEWIHTADTNLYTAKKTGKNRVVG